MVVLAETVVSPGVVMVTGSDIVELKVETGGFMVTLSVVSAKL